MKILAIDSSTMVAGVALLQDNVVIAEYNLNYKKTHSQTLLPMIDRIMSDTEFDKETLDAVAVTKGPGSFTGLRIGSATAKGLALALNIPVIGVPTVDALAYNMYGSRYIVCPIMDARRNQVYTGVYRYVDSGLLTIEKQNVLMIDELIYKLDNLGLEVIFLGDGVDKYKDVIDGKMASAHRYAPPSMSRPRAGSVASLALRYFEDGLYESADEHRPEYLRLSQAEREMYERNIVIRDMEERDIPIISEIESKIFADPWSKDIISDSMKQSHVRYLVAESRGRIEGYCSMDCFDDAYSISKVAVRPSVRHRHVGTRLIKEMMDIARENGMDKIFLEVRESNIPAVALYEKAGFKIESKRKKYYVNPVEDALVMWKRDIAKL